MSTWKNELCYQNRTNTMPILSTHTHIYIHITYRLSRRKDFANKAYRLPVTSTGDNGVAHTQPIQTFLLFTQIVHADIHTDCRYLILMGIFLVSIYNMWYRLYKYIVKIQVENGMGTVWPMTLTAGRFFLKRTGKNQYFRYWNF